MTTNKTDDAKLAQMGAIAASIGVDFKAQADAFDKASATRRERANEARDSVKSDDRRKGGFDTFMFQGLSRVAGEFGKLFNDPTTREARAAAEAAARSFTASFTGATEKTAAGGTINGYVTHIMLGTNGERVRLGLQRRIDHYLDMVEAAVEPKERSAAQELAARYTVPCGDAPLADGSMPTDKDGKPRVPRHNGRPERVVEEVLIPAGRGTDRKAQLAAASRMYIEHGDKFLTPAVLDAFLDNGGKYKAGESVANLAENAIKALERLLILGGNESADAAFLTVAVSKLSVIAKEGFAASGVTNGNVVPLTAPGTASDAAEDKAASEDEDASEDASEGTDGNADGTPESEGKPEGTESEGAAPKPRPRRGASRGRL